MSEFVFFCANNDSSLPIEYLVVYFAVPLAKCAVERRKAQTGIVGVV
jgi:hypothetical protein